MSKNRRLLLGHLLSSTALVGASAVGLTVTAPVGSALADCSTGMPMPGQTVNCSGVDNTGVYAGNGYRNITVSGSCVMKFTISSEWNPSDMGVCTPSMQATS
jgi:hypothetical protein